MTVTVTLFFTVHYNALALAHWFAIALPVTTMRDELFNAAFVQEQHF